MRVFFALALLFSPLAVSAQSIVINEVAWMGTPIVGVEEKQWWRYEWLELYNSELQNISLDGWNVVLYKGEDVYFSNPLAGNIPGQGYFLVGSSDKIPGVDVNYSNLGGKFLNTGQRVVVSNASGQVVDEVDATTGWPAGDNKTKQTMERAAGSEGAPEEWQTSKEPGGTPKSPNSEGVAKESTDTQTKLSVTKDEVKLSLPKDGTEKDPSRSSSLASPQSQSFQSRVPLVNPITLLAGFLALGFSGVLLMVRRSLASRQRRET